MIKGILVGAPLGKEVSMATLASEVPHLVALGVKALASAQNPPAQQMAMYCEVNHGGYDQFSRNSSRRWRRRWSPTWTAADATRPPLLPRPL